MCGWEEALIAAAAAAAAAGGSYMQADAANDAADRQAAVLNAAMEQQDQWARKAEGKALENADQYNMDDRTQRFEDTRQQAGDSLVASLVKSREQSPSIAQASGKISDSFTTDRATKLADQFQKSVDNARLMGNMRGTGDMINNEGIMNADYASQLNTIGRNARGDLDAVRPRMELAGKVNAAQVAAGSLISSLGQSFLASGLMGGMSGGGVGADVGNGVGNANLMANSNSVGSYANLKMM